MEEKNKVWCTDFTYLYLADGTKRYHCSILDLYDKSIVATQNSRRIDAQLAIDTLKMALAHNKTAEKHYPCSPFDIVMRIFLLISAFKDCILCK